jgi:hypothetical protein
MKVVKHPTIDGLVRNVPDAALSSWKAAGWIADKSAAPGVLATAEAPPRPCPTCGATGDEPCVTASGNETTPHAKRD